MTCSLKAVIFDLDGTLLYTLENLHKSTNFALEHFGYPKRSLEEIRNFVGNGVQKLIERALPDGIDNPDFNQCLELFKKHYSQTMYEKTRPYDGIIEMLRTLNRSGIVCAVVSNKFDSAVKELCKRYFGDLIAFAAGECEDVRKKPCPDGVLKIINQLGCGGDCVYVGDSEVDIQTAKNAGLKCISVSWGYKDKDFLIQNGAQLIVGSVEELTKAILQ